MIIYKIIALTTVISLIVISTKLLFNSNYSFANNKSYNYFSYVKHPSVKNITTQSDLEQTLQYIKQQYKKNCVYKKKVDLDGSKLLVYDSDGEYFEFDLKVISEIKSEYRLGKYVLYMGVDSKSTFTQRDEVNVIKHYNSQGFIISKEIGVGTSFNTLQNATLTRDAIRKLKKIINS